MRKSIFFFTFIVILLQDGVIGARYSDRGVELIKFLILENRFCETSIYHEYNKYDEINKHLEIAFVAFPAFISKCVGLRLEENQFQKDKRKLKIQIISDKTLNSRVIARYGLLLPVDGLYDSITKTIYITKDYDIRIIVHEYFHFLRDIFGIVIKEEEELADKFALYILELEKNAVRTKIKNY